MIDQPGIYDISEEEYHADPCVQPSLSRSCCCTLVNQSPAHAKHGHPRLNPDYRLDDAEPKFDLGTAAHSLLLEGIDKAEVIDAKDWRTGQAKALRDEARLAGKLPFLAHQYEEVLAMVEAAKKQISQCKELGISNLQKDGKAECTLIWREGDEWCRVRPDWQSNDNAVILDYKTTGQLAAPDSFSRSVVANGYDIQDAMYSRGHMLLTGVIPKFIFVVQETSEPYLCSFISLDPAFKDMGLAKFNFGLDLWSKCRKTNKWPGYPQRVCYLDAPGWAMAQWELKNSEATI